MPIKVNEAKRHHEGVLGMSFNGCHDLWAVSTIRGRVRECWRCGKTMVSGDKAFRPMGDHLHRMRRLCVECVDEIAPFKGGE